MRKMWVEQQAAPDLGAIERERDCPKYKPRKDKKLRGCRDHYKFVKVRTVE